MNLIPLVLYAAALVAYAWHFAQRNSVVGRSATTLLVAAALSHTFVIGMQTMEVGHVPVAGATSAISTFVWLLALSYLYVEMTTDERAMGVFIVPILGSIVAACAAHPALVPQPTSYVSAGRSIQNASTQQTDSGFGTFQEYSVPDCPRRSGNCWPSSRRGTRGPSGPPRRPCGARR